MVLWIYNLTRFHLNQNYGKYKCHPMSFIWRQGEWWTKRRNLNEGNFGELSSNSIVIVGDDLKFFFFWRWVWFSFLLPLLFLSFKLIWGPCSHAMHPFISQETLFSNILFEEVVWFWSGRRQKVLVGLLPQNQVESFMAFPSELN